MEHRIHKVKKRLGCIVETLKILDKSNYYLLILEIFGLKNFR